MKQILVRSDRCLGCKTCELACSIAHSGNPDLFTAYLSHQRLARRVHVETDQSRTFNLALQCRQCSEPKCVHACMTGAMYLDEATGLVKNREDKCIGCWMCVMVCPYGVITPSVNQKKALKCDQCFSVGCNPACIIACPTNAIQFIEVAEYEKLIRKDFLSMIKPTLTGWVLKFCTVAN